MIRSLPLLTDQPSPFVVEAEELDHDAEAEHPYWEVDQYRVKIRQDEFVHGVSS